MHMNLAGNEHLCYFSCSFASDQLMMLKLSRCSVFMMSAYLLIIMYIVCISELSRWISYEIPARL